MAAILDSLSVADYNAVNCYFRTLIDHERM